MNGSNVKEYDVVINGKSVELKTRKQWEYDGEPDLLVRTKFDLAADFYVQTDLYTEDNDPSNPDLSNVTRSEIVGYVTQDEVREYGQSFTPNGKTNSTLLVPREKLHPLHEFQAKLG